MLDHLSVKNLAIVESVSVAFGPGLNIITGETGAGKSVLMGALDLVLGGRADKSAIRTDESEASVDASFALANTAAIDEVLTECGLPPCEEGRLLIRRTISATSAGRCLINDTSATVATLHRLGTLLVDIHGPYDHQSLFETAFQRRILDSYGHTQTAFNAYSEIWRTRAETRAALDALSSDTTDVAAEIERLQFVIDEITQAGLKAEDGDDLVNRHAAVANAQEILALGSSIAAGLTEGDASAFNTLAALQNQLGDLARILPEAAEWKEEAAEISNRLQELNRTVDDRLSRIDADPELLQQLEDRMALVQKLKRKYGGSLEAIQATLEKSDARLRDLSSRTERIAELTKQFNAQTRALKAAGAKLTEARQAAGTKLGKAVTKELRDLGFLHAGFNVGLAPIEPDATGADMVDFGFAPNPGEPARPLRQIASSGEIARVMLAVKTVLADHDSIPVLVFDEIDANIGGEVGRAVGQKLRHVAGHHQVICITHLPQSAVYGQQHFVVSKEVTKGRTRTHIQQLDESGRVDEIARMLGGKGLTSVIEAHARELLASAKE